MVLKALFIFLLFIGSLLTLVAEPYGWLLLLASTASFSLLTEFRVLSQTDIITLFAVAGVTFAGSFLARRIGKRLYGSTRDEVISRAVASSITLLLFSMFFGPTWGAINWWGLLGRSLMKHFGRGVRVLIFLVGAVVWRLIGSLVYTVLALIKLFFPAATILG